MLEIRRLQQGCRDLVCRNKDLIAIVPGLGSAHAERRAVGAARVARLAARLRHGNADRGACIPEHGRGVRHLGRSNRARWWSRQILPALPQSFFLDIGVTAMALELIQ